MTHIDRVICHPRRAVENGTGPGNLLKLALVASPAWWREGALAGDSRHRVATARRIACSGEQTADQLVCHVQHRIRQACLEIDRRRDKDRSAAACSLTSELVGVGCVVLTHQLPQPLFMGSRCDFRRQADVAHPAEPIEQFADVVRLRCNWRRLEPSERCHVHRCVKHKQPVEFGDLLVGNPREQSVRRTPARASATGYPRSVLQAASAAASIIIGRSVFAGDRRPPRSSREAARGLSWFVGDARIR